MNKQLRVRDYLEHMLDSLRQIETYTQGRTFAEFETDRYFQDAVVRNLEIIGEAARKILAVDSNVAVRFPGIPFAAVYAMRNQLTHGYFNVDAELVWRVVERDAPELKSQIEAALAGLADT